MAFLTLPDWYLTRERVIEYIRDSGLSMNLVMEAVGTPPELVHEFIAYTVKIPPELLLRRILPEALTVEQAEALERAHWNWKTAAGGSTRTGRRAAMKASVLLQLQAADEASRHVTHQ
jgi:hypothetical protein